MTYKMLRLKERFIWQKSWNKPSETEGDKEGRTKEIIQYSISASKKLVNDGVLVHEEPFRILLKYDTRHQIRLNKSASIHIITLTCLSFQSSIMNSAALSPIIMIGALVLPPMI